MTWPSLHVIPSRCHTCSVMCDCGLGINVICNWDIIPPYLRMISIQIVMSFLYQFRLSRISDLGKKKCQISARWDKSWTFLVQISFQYSFRLCESSRFVPYGTNFTHFEPKSEIPVWFILCEFLLLKLLLSLAVLKDRINDNVSEFFLEHFKDFQNHNPDHWWFGRWHDLRSTWLYCCQ